MQDKGELIMIISSNVGYLVSCYFMVYLVWDFKWILSQVILLCLLQGKKWERKETVLGGEKKGDEGRNIGMGPTEWFSHL